MHKKTLKVGITSYLCVLFLIFCGYSCTISFQNISTHGTATDLVDEQQSPRTDISPDIDIPLQKL